MKCLGFLFVGAVALLAACDGSVSSRTQELESQEEAEKLSSSEELAVSSSSQETPGSSSSEEPITSSSSEDQLPFDTAGVTFEIYGYEHYAENEPEYGENTKNVVSGEQKNYSSCYVKEVPNGEVGVTYMATGYWMDWVLIAHEDSLLFSDVQNCSTYVWGDCREDEYAYTKKITVGGDVFYYGEFEKILMLVQLTDSTVSVWQKRNPSYTVQPQVDTSLHTGWKKSYFENDSLVTFVGDDSSSAYVDTIFIEKYNVKITGSQSTWIFKNETCTTKGYESASDATPEESCKGYGKYHNDAIKCIQRNMGVSSDVFPRLCRPLGVASQYSGVWCILDKEKEDL